jgi:hypothetical protein
MCAYSGDEEIRATRKSSSYQSGLWSELNLLDCDCGTVRLRDCEAFFRVIDFLPCSGAVHGT